jgi:putative membrane protein
MVIFLIFALLIAILAIVFALQNTGSVAVTFLVWQFHGSLALVLILALLAGMVICFFALIPILIRSRLRASSERKERATLEETLAEHSQRVESLQKELDEATKIGQDSSSSES